MKGEPNAAGSAYEVADARPGVVFGALLVLALAVAVVVWLAGVLFQSLEERAAERDGAEGLGGIGHARASDEQPPAPRLQADPALELALHRALEARRTQEYAWIDRPAGVVRIPVERAMELLLERGLPVAEERER